MGHQTFLTALLMVKLKTVLKCWSTTSRTVLSAYCCYSALGIQQGTETGKSIFFLIEANPGPSMGMLMAYIFFGRGNAKESAPGAAIIHFLGGIHEIYFPYVLMNPHLLIAVILGGMTRCSR